MSKLRDRGLGVLITDHNVRETLQHHRPRLHHVRGQRSCCRGTAPTSSPTTPEAREIYLGRIRFQLLSRARSRTGARVHGDEIRPAPAADGQQLVMTPKLQQALKLLQVPTLELQQILKQEILENPLLEEIEDSTSDEEQEENGRSRAATARRPRGRARGSRRTPAATRESRTRPRREPSPTEATPARSRSTGTTTSRTASTSATRRPKTSTRRSSSSGCRWRKQSVIDTLPEPAAHRHRRPVRRSRIGEYIIGSARRDRLPHLLASTRSRTPSTSTMADRSSACWAASRHSIRPGVGARNLQEACSSSCARGQDDSLAATIVRDHFDELKQQQVRGDRAQAAHHRRRKSRTIAKLHRGARSQAGPRGRWPRTRQVRDPGPGRGDGRTASTSST